MISFDNENQYRDYPFKFRNSPVLIVTPDEVELPLDVILNVNIKVSGDISGFNFRLATVSCVSGNSVVLLFSNGVETFQVEIPYVTPVNSTVSSGYVDIRVGNINSIFAAAPNGGVYLVKEGTGFIVPSCLTVHRNSISTVSFYKVPESLPISGLPVDQRFPTEFKQYLNDKVLTKQSETSFADAETIDIAGGNFINIYGSSSTNTIILEGDSTCLNNLPSVPKPITSISGATGSNITIRDGSRYTSTSLNKITIIEANKTISDNICL